jgi:hypothetical protein
VTRRPPVWRDEPFSEDRGREAEVTVNCAKAPAAALPLQNPPPEKLA